VGDKLAAERFVDSIRANLDYWRDEVDSESDRSYRALRPESENIRRATAYGLALSETWRQAAELLLALDYFIEQGGEGAAWQVQLQKALAVCPDSDPALKVRLLSLSGRSFRRDRDLERALRAHKQGEALIMRFELFHLLPQALLDLGTLYWRLRAYDQAQECAMRALDGFLDGSATDRQLGGVYTVLGLIAYGRGDYAESIQTLEEAVRSFQKTALTRLQARSQINLALAQEAAGDLEMASQTYTAVRSLLETTGYELEKARFELSFGTLHFNSKRMAEAEEAYLRAYSPTLRRSGNSYLLGLATNNLGNVYLEQGRLGEAEMMLRQSLVYWDRANSLVQRLNSEGTLAAVLAEQGRESEALTYFAGVIEGLEALPDDAWAQQLLEEYRGGRDAVLQECQKSGQAN
jgi:tetratricopeptide (TPR) repeat protein